MRAAVIINNKLGERDICKGRLEAASTFDFCLFGQVQKFYIYQGKVGVK